MTLPGLMDELDALLKRMEQTVTNQSDHVRSLLERSARRGPTDAALPQDAAARIKAVRQQYQTLRETTLQQLHALQQQSPELRPWKECQDELAKNGIPQILRIGTFSRSGRTPVTAPAFVPFLQGRGLLWRVKTSTPATTNILQTVVARVLVTVPPRLVKLTLIDAVNFGVGLVPFLELDVESSGPGRKALSLSGGRVLTQAVEIERQLATLINEVAEGVQSPHLTKSYQILVINNYPAGFTPEAIKHLAQLAKAGELAGVFAIVVHDASCTDEQLKPEAIYPYHYVVEEQKQCFVLAEGEYTTGQILPDHLSDQAIRNVVQAVGQAARKAGEAELAFEDRIPLNPSTWWQERTLEGITAPFGRSDQGTDQNFHLGEQPPAHGILLGTTGYGKSTLLHTLIISLTTRYSPDELELYLLDFKEGVEFADYGSGRLPHARVIGLKSDREVGLNVLRRLCEEIGKRNQYFKTTGQRTPSLSTWRRANPGLRHPPRTLLIVDEFQVLFEIQDRLAEEAAKLLGQIAAQGRSAGIHLLLATQTLQRTQGQINNTLDNLQVRILLRTAPEDAERLLRRGAGATSQITRAGQGVYTDDCEQVERNRHFQTYIVRDRSGYLDALQELSAAKGHIPRSRWEFDGNEPPSVGPRQGELPRLLPDSSAGPGPWPTRAWLGERLTVSETPATATIDRTNGNLLLVGSDHAMAGAMLTTVMLSLAIQQPHATFKFVNLTPEVAERQVPLAHLQRLLGERVTLVDADDLPVEIEEHLHFITHRRTTRSKTGPTCFLVPIGLQAAYHLQAKEVKSAWERLLEDGPAWDVHVIAWADTVRNLRRVMERKLEDSFGARVLFSLPMVQLNQMLPDPVRSDLAPDQAWLYDTHGTGELERFRPFAPVAPDLIEALAEQLPRAVRRERKRWHGTE